MNVSKEFIAEFSGYTLKKVNKILAAADKKTESVSPAVKKKKKAKDQNHHIS